MGLDEFKHSSSGVSTQPGEDTTNPFCSSGYSMDEYYAKSSVLLAASIYGPSFTARQMASIDGVADIQTITKTTGKTLNQYKDELGLIKNSDRDISDEQIISELHKVADEHGLPLTKSKVNSHCNFSAALVRSRLSDDNSFITAISNAGISVRDNQANISNSIKSSYDYISQSLSNSDSYKPDADWYVYAIKLYTDNEDTLLYVGETNNLSRRMREHYCYNGASSSKVEYKDRVARIKDIDFNVELFCVESIYSDTSCSIEDKAKLHERDMYNDLVYRVKAESLGMTVVGGF